MPSRPLTVVQVLPALVSGGVERGTLEVAAELARCGHRSIVISSGGRLVEPLTKQGSEHVQWPIGRKSISTLRLIAPLRKFLQEQRVDILHARSRVPAWIAYLAWRGMPIDQRPRFVTTVHSIYRVSPYSGIMTRGERVIAISQTVQRYIARHYPRTDPAIIRLIYRGVDEAEFPPNHEPSEQWKADLCSQFPALRTRPAVLMLPGRLVRRKGHLDFIQMLERLREHRSDFFALCVGGEDPNRLRYVRKIRQAVARAGLSAHVGFTGDRRDMADLYAFSDIVYCPSGKPVEAFGRTAVEAMTIGTPVIGYDDGGIGETLAELLPQGRIAPGDIDAMLHRTLEFLASPPAPRRNVQFTLRNMLDQTLGLYAELASARSSDRV